MRNLTLRQLRSIALVAREGKIVDAARELGLTPPAVTQQIQQAEAEAELPLFDRTSDGMLPTEAGAAYLAAAAAIAGTLRDLADRIDAIKGVRTGRLRLGVVSTAKYFAPRLMAAFMKDYPGVEIALSVGNRQETIAALSEHRIDMALMGRPPRDFPVRSAVFGDHPLVIVAAPEHALAKARHIARERIAAEHFLVREPGSGTRISLEIYLGEIPRSNDSIGIEMGSNETIKQAVMAGLGIAFISAHTIASEVEAGRLVILDVEGMPIRRQWFAVSRAERAMSPAMTAFQGFLLAKGARWLPLVGKLYPEKRPGSASR